MHGDGAAIKLTGARDWRPHSVIYTSLNIMTCCDWIMTAYTEMNTLETVFCHTIDLAKIKVITPPTGRSQDMFCLDYVSIKQ